MKKLLLFVILIVSCLLIGIIVHASYLNIIQASIVRYPIVFNDKQIDENIPMVMIEDRIYLPIRAMCEVFDIGIEWHEEGRVELKSHEDKVEKGYYDIYGWTAEPIDFEISKETALAIANDVLTQLEGDNLVSETTASIWETDNGTCYGITRYKEPLVPGGGLEVIIRKSDGKIMRIECTE